MPGPTDMVGVVAILTFDSQALAKIVESATPFASGQDEMRIFPEFVFDWYPQVLRDHIVASAPSSNIVTLQGYSVPPFLKPPAPLDERMRGSFFTRISGTSQIFLYYQHWYH
ncbi:hypothetical protein KSC_047420 [Ktedonobacter sp. SOSP1-52]|nr:hypothetical protein KSC_047420 [Ktedonobacter sp. SOSP1-52]